MNQQSMKAARDHWDGVAKPLGSLGELERAVSRIAGIQGTPDVDVGKRCVLVFCADNGVVQEGVSQNGSEVTTLVARSIAEGRGNVNAIARVAGADVFAVDIGMEADVDHPNLLMRKIAYGSRNMAREPAMTREQALEAIEVGASLVGEMKVRGYRMIATGEMGIGNTTTSSALACVLLGMSAQAVTGRGAGLSDDGLRRKLAAIERAIALNRPDPGDALDALAKVGGYDIAGMAGVFLGGLRHGVPIVIDGLISSVAALIAVRLEPEARGYMFASHVSREPAGHLVLKALALTPVICAELALGEGTGAAMLFPLLDMALSVYRQGSTFAQLGMDAYQRFHEGKP